MNVDPAITAADLRNAALVIQHASYTDNSFVNPHSGGVCLHGAIKLATTSKLGYAPLCNAPNCDCEDTVKKLFQGMLVDDERGDLFAREDAAVGVVAADLPTKCTTNHGGISCNMLQSYAPDGETRIWHYNDFECDGGEEAIDILIRAAEKLEANL